MKYISLNIYKNAWLKKEWKNIHLEENAEKIAKKGYFFNQENQNNESE